HKQYRLGSDHPEPPAGDCRRLRAIRRRGCRPHKPRSAPAAVGSVCPGSAGCPDVDNPRASASRAPLLARFARASGEMMLHRGMFESAWRKLSNAATLFADNDDWTAYAEVWALLKELNRSYTHPTGSEFQRLDHLLDAAVAAALPTTPRPGSQRPLARWVPPEPRPSSETDADELAV